jgi:hypothetical protein
MEKLLSFPDREEKTECTNSTILVYDINHLVLL